MPVDWKQIGKGVVIADMVMVNIAAGYLIYRALVPEAEPVINPNYQISETGPGLEERLAGLKQEILAEVAVAGQSGTPVPSLTPAPTAKPSSGQTAKTKTRTVQYVTIPGSGRSAKFDWENLTGTEFYFDVAEYPGLVEAYFESSMSLFNGNGKAYVRLFDSTHGVGVQGSEVETASQATTVVQSGKLNFWAGKNVIKVQAKTLTSDTAVFSYGRLRIVTEY